MKTVRLLTMMFLMTFCSSALAVSVEILDCGGIALDLCDDEGCEVEVTAEGFVAIIKVSGFDDIEAVTLTGGATVVEYTDPDDADTVISWMYSCTGDDETNVDGLRPKLLCAPQRRQLTYAIDIGGYELNDRIRVSLQTRAEEDGTEICDQFDRLVITP